MICNVLMRIYEQEMGRYEIPNFKWGYDISEQYCGKPNNKPCPMVDTWVVLCATS